MTFAFCKYKKQLYVCGMRNEQNNTMTIRTNGATTELVKTIFLEWKACFCIIINLVFGSPNNGSSSVN
jgi:hypothetical protein